MTNPEKKSGYRKYIVVIALLLLLAVILYMKTWFYLGQWSFNHRNYEKAETYFQKHVRWNPGDGTGYMYLIHTATQINDYKKAAGYILQSLQNNAHTKYEKDLTNIIIQLIKGSKNAFTREELQILFCKLTDLPNRFLNPGSNTIEFYPDRVILVLQAVRKCRLTHLVPDLEKLVFDENPKTGEEAGKTLFVLDQEIQSPIWQKILTGYPSEQIHLTRILNTQHSDGLLRFYLDILDRVNGKTKAAVLNSLSQYPSAEVVDRLIALGESADSWSDRSLFSTLNKIHDTTGNAPFNKYRDRLIEYCSSHSNDRWQGVTALLAKLNRKIPAEILDNLDTNDISGLAHWIRVVTFFKTSESESVILPFFSHNNTQIVKDTIIAQRGIYSQSVRSRIYELVQHPDIEVAQAAVEYIGADPDSHAKEFLVDLVSDENDHVVESAVKALANHPGDIVIGAYRSCLNHPSEDVRRSLASILAGKGTYSSSMVPDIIGRIPIEDDAETKLMLVHSIIEQKSDPIRRLMTRLLSDPVPKIRVKALQNLARYRNPFLVRKVLRVLNDPVPGVVLQAIHTLATYESTDAIPELEQQLENPNSAVRKAAAHAIIESLTGKERKIEFLLKLSYSEYQELKIYAFMELTEYRSPGITKRMQTSFEYKEDEVWRIAGKFLKLQ